MQDRGTAARQGFWRINVRHAPKFLFGIALACTAIGGQPGHGHIPPTLQISFPPPPQSSGGEPIEPVEPVQGLNPAMVELGRKLFHDPRLSANGEISCASCHDLNTGGVDGRAHSVGIHGAEGAVNAPTVFNVALNPSQFWDGRAATLESQIDGPVESPVEMGARWPAVVATLKHSPEYVEAFRRIFGRDISAADTRSAIAEFERSLTTPDAPFDRWLRGDSRAITPRAKRGYALFKADGCASCHQGMNVGGNMYEKLGVMGSYFRDRGNVTLSDRGRYNVTGDPEDLYMFKVPSLRNVALTAPYFHDGTVATLPEAVRLMARYQLGRSLPADDISSIVEFLGSLTSERAGRRP
ncbi:MAG TPA: cytochrome-c peroxidase [Bryobacteraceae bacterium]|nr:cytochrome-c peroxidase [Bryobacteraceae bacterium]